MQNQNNTQREEAPNAADFLGGNYLRKEDMRGPIVVTITDVWSEIFRNTPPKKLVVSFQEIPKPLILNKTNIRRLANIFQTADTARWRGPVTLYLESGVEYAGQVVGGIRINPVELPVQPPAAAAAPVEVFNREEAQPEKVPPAVNGAGFVPQSAADFS